MPIQTIEATIDEQGNVTLLEPVKLSAVHRALVTVLPARETIHIAETSLLAEASLAEDWNRSEEDEAWRHFQEER